MCVWGGGIGGKGRRRREIGCRGLRYGGDMGLMEAGKSPIKENFYLDIFQSAGTVWLLP